MKPKFHGLKRGENIYMKMLVFYRSREYTNAIISSTKAKLAQNDKVKGLEVDFINLDKRNYIKVLSQMEELPRFIYIWYDEEKVTDYIEETYPSIEVLHFNIENSINKHWDSWYNYSAKEYKLVDLMLEKFKSSLEKRTIYQVDVNYKIIKAEMDDVDIAGSKFHSFETRDKAKQYCIDCLNKEIEQIKSRIDNYEKSIKDCKAALRKRKTILKKYDKVE